MPKVTPLKVVKFKLDGKVRWRVSGPAVLAGPGKTRFRGPARKTKAEAEGDLHSQRQRLARLENHIPELTPSQSLDALRAIEIATPTGRSLEDLVRFAVEYSAILEKRKSRTFKDAWQAVLALMEGENLSPRHRSTSAYYFRFSERHSMPGFKDDLRSLSAEDIRVWLVHLPGSSVAKLNWIRYARAVVNRARSDGYVETNVLESIDPPKRGNSIKEEGITFLSTIESLRLLKAVDVRDLPWLVISMFAGIRSAEVARLTWEDVDWERYEIHVGRDKAKTKSHRLIPMEQPLIEWLNRIDARNNLAGPIQAAGLRNRLKAAKTAAGIVWHQNVLRHTFGTYWLAHYQDRAALSIRMGNTPEIVANHYARPVSKSTALEFWNLRPDQIVENGKIVTPKLEA